MKRPQVPRLLDHEAQVDVVKAPSAPRSRSSRSASMAGLKRSWRFTAAVKRRVLAAAQDPARLLESRAPSASESGPRRRPAAARGCRRSDRRERRRRTPRPGSGGRRAATRRPSGSRRSRAVCARRCGVDVEDAGDRIAEPAIGRNVRGADDPAAADDHDRPRRRGARPRLRQTPASAAMLIHRGGTGSRPRERALRLL